jgi:transposase-like protein
VSIYADEDLRKRRGRIPHADWPLIVDRYKGGETLSAIAREYDCTPSAISYILRKAEAADAEPELESYKPNGPGRPDTSVEPEPMDEIEARLRSTSSACVEAYRAWRRPAAEDTRRGLADAVHELRKVVARIEIELAASRRDEHALQPIPLPLHRAAQRAIPPG